MRKQGGGVQGDTLQGEAITQRVNGAANTEYKHIPYDIPALL